MARSRFPASEISLRVALALALDSRAELRRSHAAIVVAGSVPTSPVGTGDRLTTKAPLAPAGTMTAFLTTIGCTRRRTERLLRASSATHRVHQVGHVIGDDLHHRVARVPAVLGKGGVGWVEQANQCPTGHPIRGQGQMRLDGCHELCGYGGAQLLRRNQPVIQRDQLGESGRQLEFVCGLSDSVRRGLQLDELIERWTLVGEELDRARKWPHRS